MCNATSFSYSYMTCNPANHTWWRPAVRKSQFLTAKPTFFLQSLSLFSAREWEWIIHCGLVQERRWQMENCELMHMDKHHLMPTRNKRVLILHEYVISSVNYLSPLRSSHLLRKEQTLFRLSSSGLWQRVRYPTFRNYCLFHPMVEVVERDVTTL